MTKTLKIFSSSSPCKRGSGSVSTRHMTHIAANAVLSWIPACAGMTVGEV